MNALFHSLTGLELLDPWLLLLALFIPVGLWLRHRRGAPAIRFAPGVFLRRDSEVAMAGTGSTSEPDLTIPWRVRLLPVPRLLQVLGLLAAVLAVARPAERQRLPLSTEGIDIAMCLDVSSSMTANDMDRRRTRLEVARDAARDFISGRPDDRISLICFARYPDIRCPFTLDHRALNEILAEVEVVPSDDPEDATGIGAAVALAARMLRQSEAKSKVVILLTDGEENVAVAESQDEIAPLHAAQFCKQLGVRVYSIAAGVGRRGPNGEWIRLDRRQAQLVAEKSGGRFFEALDAGAIAAVYQEINELEKVEIDAPRFRFEERFLPFLLAALALLFLSRFSESTVLGVLP